ncbi:MOSC domain-containing protein [Oceanobacillus bengalensis]|uniref:MOSC domain-containing protein n=1 Tax=Oceanobacillus bengalensis TaxID=1435466 RepID=A0A494YUJ3_9BACI|nr:MOSC domain-containing protein [Oceanobacillus bengalensis]RKQ13812.1 MOSC domain-containing protein [Oceanobacillus bengalensis]
MEEPYLHKLFIEKAVPDVTDEVLERRWRGRIYKAEIEEKEWLSHSGLAGDIVEEKRQKREKALFAYPIKHYTYWQEENNDNSIDMGDVGENFSVLEMDEFSVCIGDTYKIGDAIIQVSGPCFRPEKRYCADAFALEMQKSGRTGWYFRVVEEGYIQSKSDMEMIDRPFPALSIAACNEAMYVNKDDLRLTYDLLSCELLSASWKNTLRKRLIQY